MRYAMLGIAGALLLAGCRGTTDVQAGDEFTLGTGERVGIEGGAAAVRFVAVPQDSRCPSDVVCVWAGDGVARLDLLVAGDSARTDLHTNGQAGSVRAEMHGYVLELVSLAPYPRSGAQIPQGDYKATLRVTAH